MGLLPEIPRETRREFITKKLAHRFGIKKAENMVIIIDQWFLHKLRSAVNWLDWLFSSSKVMGINYKLSIDKSIGDMEYVVTLRLTVEDVDPELLRKDIIRLWREAHMSSIRFVKLAKTVAEMLEVEKEEEEEKREEEKKTKKK